jgi:hypothetical protein
MSLDASDDEHVDAVIVVRRRRLERELDRVEQHVGAPSRAR